MHEFFRFEEKSHAFAEGDLAWIAHDRRLIAIDVCNRRSLTEALTRYRCAGTRNRDRARGGPIDAGIAKIVARSESPGAVDERANAVTAALAVGE